jgi:redox-sensitive bicupin YhaK (pirin superfamily)
MSTAPAGVEGEGFPVHRAFAGVPLAELDPFVHMDQMGEVDYAAGEPKGTPWHPHRGFETVTYMLDGTLLHQDSHGGGGTITDGGTQWMTAGSGILHIETPPEALVVAGGLFHGVQLWVNLPAADKWLAPRYQDLEAGQVALVTSSDAGAVVRVIAGRLGGVTGPGSTHSPIVLAHASIPPGARLEIPWPIEFNALAYALAGHGTVGGESRPIHDASLAVFGPGDIVTASAATTQDSRAESLELLLLGGRPIREPVTMYGPFVMNTDEDLDQAVADYRAGRLGTIPEGALMPHVPDSGPNEPPPIGI